MKNGINYTYSLLIILGIGVLFWIILIAVNNCDYFRIEIENTSLVLTFIGILATFVVVSNYMQTKHIEDNVNAKMSKIDKLNKDIKEIKDKMSELDKYKDFLVSKGADKAMEMVLNLREVREANETLREKGGHIFTMVEEVDLSMKIYDIAVRGNLPESLIMDVWFRYKVNIKTEEILKWNYSTGEYEKM